MNILMLTTLFPNAAMPNHGIFVENRLKAFLKVKAADVRVVAPAPWFPLENPRFGQYAAWARVPLTEQRGGLPIDHPRYFLPPKIGMSYAPSALERCFFRAASTLQDKGWDFDLIDAHYFYPDGVAAARVAKRLGKPLVITARGSDINLIPQYAGPKRQILRAAETANAIVTVADALRAELISLGAPADKITTLRNGVDLEQFQPLDRDAIRQKMKLTGPVIASVGHLIGRKGHHVVIEALSRLPDATLLIAGEGEKRGALEALARTHGVSDRVRFLGAQPHDKMAEIYSAADVLALASSREGWPNVLLEAMACGTPAVASDVWGSKEVITAPEAGRLVPAIDAEKLADAIQDLIENPPLRSATRTYAEQFSWDATANSLKDIFKAVIADKTIAA